MFKIKTNVFSIVHYIIKIKLFQLGRYRYKGIKINTILLKCINIIQNINIFSLFYISQLSIKSETI